MSTPTLSDDLKALAVDLRNLDADAANRLQDIQTKIDSGLQSELANLDLHATIDPLRIEERAAHFYQNRPWWLNWLELGRNLLVLVPIALTWFELSRAAANYLK